MGKMFSKKVKKEEEEIDIKDDDVVEIEEEDGHKKVEIESAEEHAEEVEDGEESEDDNLNQFVKRTNKAKKVKKSGINKMVYQNLEDFSSSELRNLSNALDNFSGDAEILVKFFNQEYVDSDEVYDRINECRKDLKTIEEEFPNFERIAIKKMKKGKNCAGNTKGIKKWGDVEYGDCIYIKSDGDYYVACCCDDASWDVYAVDEYGNYGYGATEIEMRTTPLYHKEDVIWELREHFGSFKQLTEEEFYSAFEENDDGTWSTKKAISEPLSFTETVNKMRKSNYDKIGRQ